MRARCDEAHRHLDARKTASDGLAAQQPLFDSAHEFLPGYSSAVQVAYSKVKGRHLLATRNIPAGKARTNACRECAALNTDILIYYAGSLLLRERPLAAVVGDARSLACSFCCRPIDEMTAHVYCTRCGDAGVRYCDEQCRLRAWRIHQFECAWLERVFMCASLNVRAALRIVIGTEPTELVAYDLASDAERAAYGLESVLCAYSMIAF